MLSFFQEHAAVETLNILSSQMTCKSPENPAADVENKTLSALITWPAPFGFQNNSFHLEVNESISGIVAD